MFLKRNHRELISSALFVLPALALFITFRYYPLAMTLFYSFTDWDGFSRNYQFVFLDNFINIFKESKAYGSFFNTIYFAVVSILVGTIIQLGLALMMDGKLKGKNFYKTVLYMPAVVSSLIIGLSCIQFFQYTGIINEFLRRIGLDILSRDWLMDVKTAMNVLIAINVWQWAGYGMVIYITGLQNIPIDIYEAADIDGASGVKKFINITFPLMMPSVTINMFISITGALRVFELPFVLTGGGPMNATNTISTLIYNTAFLSEQFGYASSIGFSFFIFIAMVTIVQLRTTRKLEVEY